MENKKSLSFLLIPLILMMVFALSLSKCGGSSYETTDKKILLSGDNPGLIFSELRLPHIEVDAYYNGEIKRIDLGKYRGRWLILFFYPSDFTFVCPTELADLASYYDEFKKAGAEIMSVSTDSAWVHRAWHKSNDSVGRVTFPMLSDRNGALSRKLGVYNPAEGTSYRATFLFNPDGECVALEIHNDAIGRNAGELLRKFDAASAVSTGGLCPGGWKPGEALIEVK